MKQAEKKYLDAVAELGCIICGCEAAIHHLRTGQGMGQRASNYLVIPLCHYHHQGVEGIHTLGTKVWQMKYKSELDFLALTIEKVFR